MQPNLTSCPCVHRNLGSSTSVPPPTYRSRIDLRPARHWDPSWDGVCSDGVCCTHRTTHWWRDPASSTRRIYWRPSVVSRIECDSFCLLRYRADVQGRVETPSQGLIGTQRPLLTADWKRVSWSTYPRGSPTSAVESRVENQRHKFQPTSSIKKLATLIIERAPHPPSLEAGVLAHRVAHSHCTSTDFTLRSYSILWKLTRRPNVLNAICRAHATVLSKEGPELS